MPALALTQNNFAGNLDFYHVNNEGRLVDANKVEFTIHTEDGATQKFPATGRADVTTAGKLSTGRYWVYDTDNTQAFNPNTSPAAALDINTRYRITWYWTETATSAEQSMVQYFDVVANNTGLPFFQYATIVDYRRAGVTETDLSDEKINILTNIWQNLVDRFTRQFFCPRCLTLWCDGRGAQALMLDIPIIGLESVRVNDETANLDNDLWCANTIFHHPRGDQNPHVSFQQDASRNIYAAPQITGPGTSFAYGGKNQRLIGMFGNIDQYTLQTPALITHALVKLILYHGEDLAVGAASSSIGPAGPLTVEKTDRHERHYAWPSKGPGMSYKIFGDPEVTEILTMYKGPVAIGAPATKIVVA